MNNTIRSSTDFTYDTSLSPDGCFTMYEITIISDPWDVFNEKIYRNVCLTSSFQKFIENPSKINSIDIGIPLLKDPQNRSTTLIHSKNSLSNIQNYLETLEQVANNSPFPQNFKHIFEKFSTGEIIASTYDSYLDTLKNMENTFLDFPMTLLLPNFYDKNNYWNLSSQQNSLLNVNDQLTEMFRLLLTHKEDLTKKGYEDIKDKLDIHLGVKERETRNYRAGPEKFRPLFKINRDFQQEAIEFAYEYINNSLNVDVNTISNNIIKQQILDIASLYLISKQGIDKKIGLNLETYCDNLYSFNSIFKKEQCQNLYPFMKTMILKNQLDNLKNYKKDKLHTNKI